MFDILLLCVLNRLAVMLWFLYTGGMKTAVIGSGGREHAIAWRLALSKKIESVLCIPGNGGTAMEHKCRNLPIAVTDHNGIVEALIREHVAFAVIGPEDPLADGIADALWNAGIATVGAKQRGAQLEASKDLSKAFMQKYGVACAASKTFTDSDEAIDYIRSINRPCAVKADGLAAGKGVVVAKSAAAAEAAVISFMKDGSLGDAGKRVLIEDYLEGVECSVLAAVSVTPDLAAAGKACIKPFVASRDHKRLRDGAAGPNTGGMGAVAPVQLAGGTGRAESAQEIAEENHLMHLFNTTILEPTLKGLIAEKFDYRGFIFFGLMVGADGPKVIEYNVRLGDPETQAVFPLMDSDFADLCNAIICGNLDEFPLAWKSGVVCSPVAVSGGYPGAYKKNVPISIDKSAAEPDGTKVFIAGASLNKDNQLVTSGGRVLAASSFGGDLNEARNSAYTSLQSVSFDGMFYRSDIGLPGAAASATMD